MSTFHDSGPLFHFLRFARFWVPIWLVCPGVMNPTRGQTDSRESTLLPYHLPLGPFDHISEPSVTIPRSARRLRNPFVGPHCWQIPWPGSLTIFLITFCFVAWNNNSDPVLRLFRTFPPPFWPPCGGLSGLLVPLTGFFFFLP